jgi:hypothetical protein
VPLGEKYVVHTECHELGKRPWYHQGDYFPKNRTPELASQYDRAAMTKAWQRFDERGRRAMRLPPFDK